MSMTDSEDHNEEVCFKIFFCFIFSNCFSISYKDENIGGKKQVRNARITHQIFYLGPETD